MNCPFCQKPLNVMETISERPFVCPHCLSNIENPRLAPASQAPNVLRDIRYSVLHYGWTFWLILFVLAGLCVGGIAYAKFKYLTDPASRYVYVPAADYCPGFLGLDVLAFIAIGRLIWLFFGKAETPAQKPVLGVSGVVALTLLAGLGAAVFFFAVCNAL